ncbi:MAG: metal-binding protein [Candidatus Rokuibacteriota bacterium]
MRTYTLLGPDRRLYESATPGTLGGRRPGRRYGRLDCPAALRAIARGGYVKNRVFFADEPCAACLPEQHARWKARNSRLRTPGGASARRVGDRAARGGPRR